jgi:hypothetical protein
LLPGTASPSPRGFCPPKENDKPSEATRELKSRAIRLMENFIVIRIAFANDGVVCGWGAATDEEAGAEIDQ